MDDVAFDLNVARGELHGAATMFAVTGPWWCRVASGWALASEDVADDEPTLQALLTAILRSGAA